jgi:hypothetical protein
MDTRLNFDGIGELIDSLTIRIETFDVTAMRIVTVYLLRIIKTGDILSKSLFQWPASCFLKAV